MVTVAADVFLDVFNIFSFEVIGDDVRFGGFFHAPKVPVDVIGGEEKLFVVRSADAVDGSHVFAGEGRLVDGFEGVLHFFKFWHVHLFSRRFAHLFETFFKQFPHFNIPFVCCYQLLVFSLSGKPLHTIDGLGDLLALEGIELPAVGLEFGVVLKSLRFFLGVLLELENDNSSCMVTQSEVLPGLVERNF